MGNTVRKILAFILFIIILASSIFGVIWFVGNVLQNGGHTTLVVPDKYPTIQSAIDNASAGDTVFVKDGTYYVNTIDIDKPINLVGQDPNETIIIDNSKNRYYSEPIFSVAASNVEISGFTLTDSQTAIEINAGNGIKIIENNIVNNNYLQGNGITVNDNVNNLVISKNNITNNYVAIGTQTEDNNLVISHNMISDNAYAIGINGGENGIISDNTITNNSFGIGFEDTLNLNICRNNILSNIAKNQPYNSSSGYAIQFLWGCIGSVIHDNNIEANTIGVDLQNFPKVADNVSIIQGSRNMVYQNNFVNNIHNANVENQKSYTDAGIATETAIISWNNGKLGNYWSDYNGQGAYVIDQNNVDNYPLTQQVNISTQTPTSLSNILTIVIIAITVSLVVVVSLLLYRRHRKNSNLSK